MQRMRSRLARKEGQRLMRQTVVLILLSVVLLVGLLLFGIPALIKVAIFFGELRSSTQPVEQSDSLPPAQPQLASLPEATTSASLAIHGFAEPKSLITLYRDRAKDTETTTDEEGAFSFAAVDLTSGENEFYVIATDEAGNESESSKHVSVLYDREPPELSVSQPADGETIFGETKRIVTVVGTTEPRARIVVNERLAVVGGEGEFSVSMSLTEGDNKIVVTATDAAGNQTSQELIVHYSP